MVKGDVFMIKKNFGKYNICWNKILEYCLPAIVTIFLFVIAMIVKGVYPFGGNSVGYIDFDDGLVPSYTGLWDVLHGNFDVLVNWNLGAGGSYGASAVLNSFLSPICWLVAIFPRCDVIYSITLVLIIMLALMATTSYICFKSFFPNVNKWVVLLFSLIWVFSGWTLIHFTNIGWLNLMILLPLLLMSAYKLVSFGKYVWFVIILTYMLLLSYYITYMILVATVVVSTIYIIMFAKDKKRVASRLFFAIIISILMSVVCFIPSCITSLQGHRFSGSATANPRSTLFSHFFSKWAVLIVYALPVVLFVRLIATYRSDKRNVLFFILSMAICSIGLIIEPINMMWHTGSYYCFPLRYGFVLIFILIMGSLYYLNKSYYSHENVDNFENIEIHRIAKESVLIGAGIVYVISVACFAFVGGAINAYRELSFVNFLLFLIPFASSYVIIEVALRLHNKKLYFARLPGGIIIMVVCCVQIIAGVIGYCGDITNNTMVVTNSLNVEVSELDNRYKIKDRENLYNLNFPLLMDFPSMSSWIHISSEEQFVGYHNLGYETCSTTLMSSGGTIITDVILGNKYILSREVLDNRYYELIDQVEYVEKGTKDKQVVNLYQLKFNMSVVFTTDVDLSQVIDDSDNWFANHNELYQELYGQEDEIISAVDYTIAEVDPVENTPSSYRRYQITVDNVAGSMLYLSNKIDEEVRVIGDTYNYNIYNGLADMGIHEEDHIEIVVEVLDDYGTEEIANLLNFGCLDIAKFQRVCNSVAVNDSTLEYDGANIKVYVDNVDGDKYALIPFVNLKNMSGIVNNRDVAVLTAFDTFMMIELDAGANKITLSHQPQLLSICAIISLVSVATFVMFIIINNFVKIGNNKVVVWIGTIGGCVILIVVGVLVYVKPLITFVTTVLIG